MKTKLDAAKAIKSLKHFIGPAQIKCLADACYGEERQFFFDKLCALADLVAAAPKTYEQDGKGDQAVAFLHYFAGGQANWWITEKDSDPDGAGQIQAFGRADLFADGGELGYISIAEILENGGELDLYYTPKTLAALDRKEVA